MLSLGEIAARQAQVRVLNEIIEKSESKIKNLLEAFGWSEEKTLQTGTEMVSCPNNENHRVPKSKLDEHVKTCNWKQEGYNDFDLPLPESCGPYANHEGTSITIDKELQRHIIEEAAKSNPAMITGVPVLAGLDYRSVPETSDRLLSDFSADERLALYDYAVSKTNPPAAVQVDELHLISDLKNEEKQRPKTKLEILIEERNAKRRRAKYRNSVHTSRKSHTEIVREVIKNQMDVLEEMIKAEYNEKNVEHCPEETIESSTKELLFHENSPDRSKTMRKKEKQDSVMPSEVFDSSASSSWRESAMGALTTHKSNHDHSNPYRKERYESVTEQYNDYESRRDYKRRRYESESRAEEFGRYESNSSRSYSHKRERYSESLKDYGGIQKKFTDVGDIHGGSFERVDWSSYSHMVKMEKGSNSLSSGEESGEISSHSHHKHKHRSRSRERHKKHKKERKHHKHKNKKKKKRHRHDDRSPSHERKRSH